MFPGLLVAVGVALIAYAASSLGRGRKELINKTHRRVFVFDMKTGLATVLRGKYEWVPLEESRRLLLCGDCAKKDSGSDSKSDSAYRSKSVAYVCVNCGKLVWRDDGKAVPFDAQTKMLSKEDRETIERITAELSQPCNLPTLAR